MGQPLFSRRNLIIAVPATNITATNLIIPGTGMKLVMNIVPLLAGVLTLVRSDGGNIRTSILNDGVALIAGKKNLVEVSAPKFYSFKEFEVVYNLQYSLATTFTHITIYAEKEHAATLSA